MMLLFYFVINRSYINLDKFNYDFTDSKLR